jgi:ABC-type dipeptide/oligopeptide/nickel transport system permease component
MFKFAARHTAGLLITLILVSLIIAAIFSFIPGDPATLLTGTNASPEQREALRESLGLNHNMFQRYVMWIKALFSLHTGGAQGAVSTQYGMPINRLLGDRLIVTSSIALLASVFMLLVSVPLGFLAAYKKNTWIDALVNNVSILGLSIPNYLTGILLIWLCGITFRLFTPGQFVHYSVSAIRYWQSLFFPALAVAIPNSAMLTKFIRNSVWDEMHEEYTNTAKSKGASRLRILFFHVAQNAATPVLTVAGILIAEILSGSIVIEQVFAIPGLGRLLIGGINARDFPIVITVTVYIAFIVVIVNFIFELLSRLCDPRTRLE